jgi:hypothetical protein
MKKEKLYIVSAAIKTRTGAIHSIPPPARHHNIVHVLADDGHEQVEGDEQGFLLNNGIFVNRIEGGKIAIDSGQINKLRWPPNLYSEDLW